jgi:hypothetical protein
MSRVNVYCPAALKLVAGRRLGPGWAARCLRRGVMEELRAGGWDSEVAAAAGHPTAGPGPSPARGRDDGPDRA